MLIEIILDINSFYRCLYIRILSNKWTHCFNMKVFLFEIPLAQHSYYLRQQFQCFQRIHPLQKNIFLF